MTAILHLNDNNLLLQSGNGWHRSQGYAWLKNGDVFFDFSDVDNAVAACRLEPQQINSRYWQQCEQTAIASNTSGMRHAADLIWRHLTEFKSRHQLESVILIVPSHYQAANLQLLLGIAKAVGLEVTALINKAVFAANYGAVDSHLHIDVQLHQTVCSEVSLVGSNWALGKIEILHEVGLQNMQDALLKAIQERFVLSDRFDPLHYAETEQQLFDQLPRLAEQIHRDGKATVLVEHLGRQHSTSIDIKQWSAALAGFASILEQAQLEGTPGLRVYDFNGFAAIQFNHSDRSLYNQATVNVDELRTLIGNDDQPHLIYQTELAVTSEIGTQTSKAQLLRQVDTSTLPVASQSEPTINSSTEVVANGNGATHLLQHGVAVPISRAAIIMENNMLALTTADSSNLEQMMVDQQLFVMGDAQRQQLQINDRIGSNLADGVITVIRVE